MLWLLEFTREGHRYRAELRADPGVSREPSRSIAEGFWFVSMDGNPPHLAFAADVRDEDTEEFRRRVVSAALGESGGLRAEREEPAAVDHPSDEPGEDTEDHPRPRR